MSETNSSRVLPRLALAGRGMLVALILVASPLQARVNVASPEVTADGLILHMDVAALMNSRGGDEVTLNLGDVAGERLLTTTRVVTSSSGVQTWVGYDAARGELTRTYISGYQGAVTGVVYGVRKRYELVPATGGGSRAKLVDYEAEGLVRFIGDPNDGKSTPKPEPASSSPHGQAEPIDPRNHQKALPSPQATVDLAILYTAGMVTKYGNTAGVLSRLATLVQVANDAYINSEVAITLNLVGTKLSPHPDTGFNYDALDDITGKNTSAGCLISGCDDLIPLPALATEARTFREQHGADLVSLVRPFSASTHGSCGVAWNYQRIPNVSFAVDTAFGAQFGYSVVSDGSNLGSICYPDTMAHELGHNMGLAHDRPNSINPSTGLPSPGVTAYAFGVGFNYPPQNPTRAALGDIMSYATDSVPFFSTPLVTCNVSGGTCQLGGSGTPLGAAGDTDTGACTTNPLTCADNSRALNYTRPTISAFRVRTQATISGTVANGAGVAGVTFCLKSSVAGGSCTASLASGSYTCTVPAGWSGQLHAAGPAGFRIKPQTFTNVTTNLTNQNPVVQAVGACSLDVDNNGLIEPSTDGVAILRRMMGMDVGAFSGLAGSCAANTSASAIFAATSSSYNVTAGTSTTTAGRDGMVILRAMQGLTGTSVTNGLGLASEPGAANTSWPQLQTWLNTTCGTNF